MQTQSPKITWNTSFATTLSIQYPVDNFSTYSQPRDGSTFAQSQSGIEDSWIIGTDYYLEVDIRWIPITDTGSATGWDGATSWRGFLEWARAKNAFRFYPDKDSGTFYTSFLLEPALAGAELEIDGTRRIRLVMRNATTAYLGY